jgi:hypothetical protein
MQLKNEFCMHYYDFFPFQGNEFPKPESMLEANIKATYYRSINMAKDLYLSGMQEATKSGRYCTAMD